MKSRRSRRFALPPMNRLHRLTLTALLLTSATLVSAQVYRVIDANGRVTYTDTPPAANSQPTQVNVSPSSVTTMLPYELQQVVARFPVTLYTTNNCSPCALGRALLVRRGVPFTERTVNTPQDAEALQRLAGQTDLPFMTIGTQHIKGFSESEWTRYLDAAEYPSTTQLQSNYRQAPGTPLVYIPPKPVAQPASIPASMLNGGFPVAPARTDAGKATSSGIRF